MILLSLGHSQQCENLQYLKLQHYSDLTLKK